MSSLSFRCSPIHGIGAYATQPFRSGDRVLEYVGNKITKAKSLRLCAANNEYIFALDDEFDLDGSVKWNLARFLNHSCDPNCEAERIGGRIWILALGDIAPDEEITFNYGYDLEDYRNYPCSCGSPVCVGFMVAAELLDCLRHGAAGGTR